MTVEEFRDLLRGQLAAVLLAVASLVLFRDLLRQRQQPLGEVAFRREVADAVRRVKIEIEIVNLMVELVDGAVLLKELVGDLEQDEVLRRTR